MGELRLIEAAFPLKQVSLDSVHEKNVRHGHISTLHIWPARRPLAASRAALLATLLRDPGTREARRKLLARMAGRVETGRGVDGADRAETRGGVLHWGRESDREGVEELARFRAEIRDAFGGRAPRVLDPFAGGGAIPLEAMRLGCETVAADISPVAWFILRCTLHYPQRLVGQRRPLPPFALTDRPFVEAFLKAQGIRKPAALREVLAELGHRDGEPVQTALGDAGSRAASAGVAWHLRAWGRQVLAGARRSLAGRYPTYAEFEPLRRRGRKGVAAVGSARHRRRAPRLLEPDADGRVSTGALNAEFDSLYLENESNPRWVAKPAVAYLWARTVRCGGCRAEMPLLETRWLCKTAKKRIRLTVEPRLDGGGVDFGIEHDVPDGGGNAAQKRERDRVLGEGTMSASGARCPTCGAITTTKDIRAEGRSLRLGQRMTAVVVDGQLGKEYRLPTEMEKEAARVEADDLQRLYGEIPFGVPTEPVPKAGVGASRAFSVDGYGYHTWRSLFTDRQILALGALARAVRRCSGKLRDYPEGWREAIVAYMAASISRLADRGSALATWTNDPEKIRNTFARFALPMVWDFVELCPLTDTTSGFVQAVEWVARVVEHLDAAAVGAPAPEVVRRSATARVAGLFDLICTDPPYYDAIPYSDLMDFFHVWLRRTLQGLSPEVDAAFAEPLGPKWDAKANDGELIDDAARFDNDRQASKRNYESGMARAFGRFREALRDDGRLVIVFANKSPDAWETLVSALIRAGFVVTGSWPIQTERQTRQRSLSSAALASSIWLVCRKRPATARPGWDNRVLADMQTNVTERLVDFWDACIRGPDFVWAATGPALEAFSRHPVVRKADAPGRQLTVDEFLRRVRRMVVGFVVSRLLDEDEGAVGQLDDPTTYYLLHRKDFGLAPAPAGACILYALSCNLSDAALTGRLDLLAGGGRSRSRDEEGDQDGGTSGSDVRLKTWNQRRARDLGEPSSDGNPPPLIDCVHKLMQLWKSGEQSRVDAYLEARGLWRHEIFARVVQAVTELAEQGSEERATLESIQTHVRTHGGASGPRPMRLDYGDPS